MGLWNKLFGEFVDVIEWLDDSSDTMVYRFERFGNEIKYGAMMTVRESQVAVLVNEGRVADLYEPGLYKLETNNMPILTTLENWPHGFNSPFKTEVWLACLTASTSNTPRSNCLRVSALANFKFSAFALSKSFVKSVASLTVSAASADRKMVTAVASC